MKLRDVAPRLAADDVPDILVPNPVLSGKFGLVGRSCIVTSANVADLIFGQLRLPKMPSRAVLDLVTSLAQRFQVARIAVCSIAVSVMDQQEAAAPASLARPRLGLSVVPCASPSLPRGIVRARSLGSKPSLLFAKEHVAAIATELRGSLRRFPTSPANLAAIATLRPPRSGIEWLVAGFAGIRVAPCGESSRGATIGSHRRPPRLRRCRAGADFRSAPGFAFPELSHISRQNAGGDSRLRFAPMMSAEDEP
jgi:hypothetical protein